MLLVSTLGIAACSTSEAEPSSASSPQGQTAEAVQSSLSGVDPFVVDGLAPIDSSSHASSILLEMSVYGAGQRAVERCLADQGIVVPPSDSGLPDRAELEQSANAEFPAIDSIRSNGLFNSHAATAPDRESDTPPPSDALIPGLEAALPGCQEAVSGEIRSSIDLFGSIRGSWQNVIDEVDGLPEIVSQRSDFSQCLVDQGISADDAVDETAFLLSVDVRLAAATDADSRSNVYREMGTLYIDCGESYLRARVSEREARRVEFLLENEEAVREIAALVES